MNNQASEAFRDLVSTLKVDVSVDSQGLYTVCSQAEPFFCYEGDSRDAVVDLSVRTLASYARTFLGLSDLRINVRQPDALPFVIERSEKVESVYLEAA